MSEKARSVWRRSPWHLLALSVLLTCVLLVVAACSDLDSDATTTTEVELSAMTTTVPEATPTTPATAAESTSTSESATTTSSDSTTTTSAGLLPLLEAELSTEAIYVPLAWTRYENTDSHLHYLGQWHIGYSLSMSGGSYSNVNVSHAGVVIDFDGSRIRLMCLKNASQGKMEVTLDNGPSVLVDLWSSSSSPQQIVWTSDVLDLGEHTLLVGWTGLKNPSSAGTFINIDAVEVKGTLE